MRKGSSLIGKEVLGLADGVRIETVNDVVIDPDGRRLVALVVDEGGFLSSSKAILTDDVSSFGKDAIIVPNSQTLLVVADNPELRELLQRKDKLIGRKVFTVDGAAQGAIKDIYFDEATGAIVGYEVTAGTLADLATGVSYLPVEDITTIGPDAIYVVPEAAVAMDAQVGGLKGALDQAGERIGERAAGASESTAEGLIGKRAGADVEAADGSVVIPEGRRIRPQDVEAAKTHGVLPALTASVAKAQAAGAADAARDALAAAGDTAGSLWDQFTRKIGEMHDASGKRIDEEQTRGRLAAIADAIGRPVTKVILDRADEVVLNLGDIVTHRAVQRAHEAGGLDSLLASVYRGTVEFSKEEMRAPGEAGATVDRSPGGAPIVDELEAKVEGAEREQEAERDRKAREADAEREAKQRARDERQHERAAKAPPPPSPPTDVGEPPPTPTSG